MGKKLDIMTVCGPIKGEEDGTYARFLGIPYATAERFGSPHPVRWTSTLDCTKFGKKAMQDFENTDMGNTLQGGAPQSREEFDENCLNLNVYVPLQKENSSTPKRALPVLFEVHGGAFQRGSNQAHTPAQILKDHEFIYVSINYRLGVFGFLYLDELLTSQPTLHTGNLGLQDILSALEWVYTNIGAFGGDPERITVLASSAGAKAIATLMCTPHFNRYTHQLILASGSTQSIRDKQTANQIAQEYMAVLHKTTEDWSLTPADLKTLSADTLLEAQKLLCCNPGNTCIFGPVADGDLIPEDWQDIARKGTLWEGRAMIGCSLHEEAFYKILYPDFSAQASWIADELFGENSDKAQEEFNRLAAENEKALGRVLTETETADLWVRILTDYMYRTHSYRLAKRLAKKGSIVWQYSVEFKPALHCFDQMLAFGIPTPDFFDNEAHMKKGLDLGEQIYDAFTCFIETGSPVMDASTWPALSDSSTSSSANSSSRDSGKPVQMVWDEQSYLRPIAEGEVLESIGEQVFKI